MHHESEMGFLDIKIQHIYGLQKLALHHGDPFDRLLISQSISEDMTLVSRDNVFAKYPVKTTWK
jgi:PIN domain nuclease of toxin-antitoxin system